MGKSSLMLDIAISYGTEQYHMEQTSLMWDRPLSCGTDQSHVGERSIFCKHRSLASYKIFLKVSWITRMSKKTLASPGLSLKLQNIFLWFITVSWIAWMSIISLQKFCKSWNVLQASKYFSMIFKSLLDCQNVQNNLEEVWQVLECLKMSGNPGDFKKS